MGARYDISRFTIPLIITALALLASLFFLPCTGSEALRYSFASQYLRIGFFLENPGLSKIASILLLAACPLMFYAMDRSHPLAVGSVLPLIYSLLVLSCKDALCLSPIHLAAFFLTWSLFFSFRASLEPYNIDNPFVSMMMLSTASLFFVPLIWLAPVMAVLDNNNSTQKLRTIVGSVCGLLLPMLMITGISTIVTGYKVIEDPVLNYLAMTIDIEAGIPQMQVATVMKVLIVVVSVVWAAVSFIKTFSTLDIAAERCHIRCIVYGVCLTAIAILFGKTLGSLPWILALMPLSMFVFAFFTRQAQQRNGTFLLAILLLLVIAERIVIML
ncbi:MAG: hypothetical protein J6T49_06155 [Bacteroidales bacterium]|nr:hypothetical protein [Bacteroidales bacterium]MBO7480029.1 hypothetical protein [Bacteroidales bacterium]MBO7487728.1 hypothetical protein [Bacteroidales bacterium]